MEKGVLFPLEVASLYSHHHHFVGTLFLPDVQWTLRTRLRKRHNTLHNSSGTHQHGNHRNNKRYIDGLFYENCEAKKSVQGL